MIALVIASHGATQLCKWEDGNGVTHYDKKCLEGIEGIEGTEIKLDAAPTKKQVKDTQKRSAQPLERK